MIDLEELAGKANDVSDDPAEAMIDLAGVFATLDKTTEALRTDGDDSELAVHLQAAFGTLKSLLVGAGAQRSMITKLRNALEEQMKHTEEYRSLVGWIMGQVTGIKKEIVECDCGGERHAEEYWVIDFLGPDDEQIRVRGDGTLSEMLKVCVESYNEAVEDTCGFDEEAVMGEREEESKE